MRSAELAEETGLGHDRIILSAQGVGRARPRRHVPDRWRARSDYPLHLGLTEAGMGDEGDRRVDRRPRRSCSTRGSATRSASRSRPEPGGGPRARGGGRPAGAPVAGPALVPAAGLRVPGLRPHDVDLLPGDGAATSRTTSRTGCRPGARRTRASRRCNVAVMGCVVNGPGESKHADIGISLPGTFESPVAPVFIDGQARPDAPRRRTSSTSSSRSSRTTSTAGTAPRRRPPRAPGVA